MSFASTHTATTGKAQPVKTSVEVACHLHASVICSSVQVDRGRREKGGGGNHRPQHTRTTVNGNAL